MGRDTFHPVVRAALEKDGWQITDDPYLVPFGGVEMQIDLGAEKLLAATKDERTIAVEVKSFLSTSILSEFHTALGQFLNYRLALADVDPHRELYLAVPIDTYSTFFMLRFAQSVLETHRVALIVYDPQDAEVVLWRP